VVLRPSLEQLARAAAIFFIYFGWVCDERGDARGSTFFPHEGLSGDRRRGLSEPRVSPSFTFPFSTSCGLLGTSCFAGLSFILPMTTFELPLFFFAMSFSSFRDGFAFLLAPFLPTTLVADRSPPCFFFLKFSVCPFRLRFHSFDGSAAINPFPDRFPPLPNVLFRSFPPKRRPRCFGRVPSSFLFFPVVVSFTRPP